MKIPDRWLNYSNGNIINGTRFVACKVPLREGYNRNLPPEKCFSPCILLQEFPSVKLVVDLTNTFKYYRGRLEFESKGIQYEKIKCKGREIPDEGVYGKFCEVVDEFLANNPEDYLIAVHCTHGVNRTGYIIVRYMIEKLGYTPNGALEVFFESRGHDIERVAYKNNLRNLVRSNSPESEPTPEQQIHRNQMQKPRHHR